MISIRQTLSMMALMLIIIAAPALAIVPDSFEIADNGWTYLHEGLQSERLTHDFGFSYLRDSSLNDSLYQNTWWYRTAGDTREYGFSALTDYMAMGPSSAHLTYEEAGSDGTGSALLRFELIYTIVGVNDGHGYLRTDWSLTNLTDGSLPVELFNYVDFDVAFDSSNDTALLTSFGPSYGQIKAMDSDAGKQFSITAAGAGLSAWEIGVWPWTVYSLTDDEISNLSSATSPNGPDDMAGAFQYTLNLGGGQTAGGYTVLEVSTIGSVVPEPGSILSLLAGMIGLVSMRRLKR